jgi:hypothetical protein
MSSAAFAIIDERTGGREHTSYAEFVSRLMAVSGFLRWLNPDEIVTSVMELIDAGLDEQDARKGEVYSKFYSALQHRIEDQEDFIELEEEKVHEPTVQMIQTMMKGGRETA